MSLLYDLVGSLCEANIDVIIRKNRDRPCAYLTSGFYRCDGDAYVFENRSVLILYTRFGGEKQIQILYDLAYESHIQWKLSRNQNPRWKDQSPNWIPLYQRLKLEPFDRT